MLGLCFTGPAEIGSGRQQETLTVGLCLSAQGISVTRADGSTVNHGSYLGWSSTDLSFGFVNGTVCTAGPLLNKATIQRASRVTFGCCSAAAVYITRLGEAFVR